MMEDDEGTIEAMIGEEIVIDRASNPTTGYRWEARFDDEVLELKGERYERLSTRIGGGGRQVFVFVSLREGDTTVHLCYKRPWETDMDQVRVFRVHIAGQEQGGVDPPLDH